MLTLFSVLLAIILHYLALGMKSLEVLRVKQEFEEYELKWKPLISSLVSVWCCNTDYLSKTLQHKSFSAAEGQQVASTVIQTLRALRDVDSFDLL